MRNPNNSLLPLGSEAEIHFPGSSCLTYELADLDKWPQSLLIMYQRFLQ